MLDLAATVPPRPQDEARPREPLIVGKSPEGPSAAGWGDSNSSSSVLSTAGQGTIGGETCRFDERSVTVDVRCCPWFARRLRTQYGPRGPVPSGRGRHARPISSQRPLLPLP
jgi:hypothetical protein